MSRPRRKTSLSASPLCVLGIVFVVLVSRSAAAVEYWLCADWTLKALYAEGSDAGQDGAIVWLWGFAKSEPGFADDCRGEVGSPGPMLVIPERDNTLTIHLDNRLPYMGEQPVSVSIVIPGIPSDADGSVALPGEPATYTWKGLQPGTYIYRSGVHPEVQVPMGLYGGIKMDSAPGLAYPDYAYHQDVVLYYSEIDPALNWTVLLGGYDPGSGEIGGYEYNPRYVLVNGEYSSQYLNHFPAVEAGRTTLLRFLNVGRKTYRPVVLWSYMDVIAENATPYPAPVRRYAALLDPDSTKDALFTNESVGLFEFLDALFSADDEDEPAGDIYTYLIADNSTTDREVDSGTSGTATEVDVDDNDSGNPNPPTSDVPEEEPLPAQETGPSSTPAARTPGADLGGPPGGGRSISPQTGDKYLDAAIRFADIVLSKGRDTYGPKKTPLFVDALSVIDHTPYRWKNRLQRTNQDFYPSEWISADFSIQQTLQATLRELSKVTGDRKYERAAREAAAYVLSNLTFNTVPPWGMHQTYDALNDVRVGLAPSDRTNAPLHEIHSVVPEYLYLARINSDAVRSYITTYVNSSVQQWSGLTFTRHVGYWPNANVFDKVSQINRNQQVPFQGPSNMRKWHYQMALIQQGVEYSLLYGDERAWTMAEEIIKRNVAMRRSNGLGPHAYEFMDPDNPTAVISIRDHRYESMPQLLMYLGEIVGSTTTKGHWLIKVALEELKAWKRGALISGTSDYRQQFGAGKISPVPPQVLWEYAYAYRLTQDPDMWGAARDIIRGYGIGDIGTTTGDGLSVSGTYILQPLKNADESDQRVRNRPNNFNAFTINALVELYWATNDARFLDMAENVADVIMDALYDNGLFVRQKNGLYGRTGDFMPLALVNLSAARRDIKMDKESIIARNAYLRVPHDTTAWWNRNDKAWDNEIVYCRDKYTNLCK